MADIRPIFKARVSSVEGTKARVIPLVGGEIVTRPLVLVWWMRDGMCPLAVGDVVWCARAEDGDGIVLCRADGEWGFHIPWSYRVTGDVDVSGSETLGGSVTAGGDVTGAGISLDHHTHTGVHGETSGPH